MIKSLASVCLLNDDIDDDDQLIKKSWWFVVAFLKKLSVFPYASELLRLNILRQLILRDRPPSTAWGGGGWAPIKLKLTWSPEGS